MPGATNFAHVDVSVQESEILYFVPKNAISDSLSGVSQVVEFEIPPLHSYIDFKSLMLDLSFSIVKHDGTVVDPSTRIMFIPNIIQSLIRSISISFNDQEVCDPNPFYSLVSFLQVLLGLPKVAEDTIGEAMGYYNVTTKSLPSSFELNSPSARFFNKIQNSKNINVCGPLMCDFMTAQSYFPSDVKIKIEITFHTDGSFPVWTQDTDTNSYKIKLRKSRIILKTYRPTLEYFQKVENEDLAADESFLHFNYKRHKAISYSIPSSSSYLFIQNPFSGFVPELLFIIFQTQACWNGKYHENPLHFQHYDLSQILIRNGNNVAYNLTCDFQNEEGTALCYLTVLESLGLEHANRTSFTYKDFIKGGKTIFAFDLTKDGFSMDKNHFDIRSNLDIEIKLKNPTVPILDVILIALTSAEILIDKRRKIIVNSSI